MTANLTVIDVETTGLDPKTCHVIEIASVDLKPDGIANLQSFRVKPPAGVTIPPEVSAVTHLVDADLDGAPPLADVLAHFSGRKTLVAHNAAFDSAFLSGLAPVWICTHKCALRAWPDAPAHSNQALRYWLGDIQPFGVNREDIHPHRASSDVLVTAAIFHRLVKAGVTWDQMIQWSAEPPVFPRMMLGKERGKKMADVDAGFISWVLGKADLSDWHHTCRLELQRRKTATGAAA